ncbi:MAG: hypothetical protein ACJ736_15230 [Streptomyces sp.]
MVTLRGPGAPGHAERGRVLDEIIDVCRAVWPPDPVQYEDRHTRIASARGGPRTRASIPDLLPSPMVMAGTLQLAEAGCQLRDLTAERVRTRPIRTSARVNAQYVPKAYDGPDRAVFQSSGG